MSASVKVGELFVGIVASAGGFIKPVKDSSKELTAFTTVVKTSDAVVGGFNRALAALGVTLSAGGIVAWARSSMLELDKLGKTAAKIGVETSNLAALRFGGEQSGLGAEVIDKGLQKLTQRISEVAATGKGDALPVLERLKLNVSALAKLPADKQLDAIADAMGRVGSQGEKVWIATKLFEEEGVGLLNLLKDGSGGLRKFRDEAKQLGIDFGTDAVKGVEEANLAINRLKHSLDAIGTTIVVEMAPSIAATAEKLATAVREYNAGRKLQEEKGKKSFVEEQFPMTLRIAGFVDRNIVQPRTAAMVREDIAAGIAMGTPAAVKDLSSTVGMSAVELSARKREFENRERLRADREKTEAGGRALGLFMDKGGQKIGGFVDWMKTDGLKAAIGAAEKIEELKQKARSVERGLTLEALIRPPGWMQEREQHAKDREQREKRKQDLESWKPSGLNSAIEANSAEAFRVIAESRVPQMQLEVQKRANDILKEINAGVRAFGVAEVGIN